jgi:hypothetical protein
MSLDDKIFTINEEVVSRNNQDGTVVLMKMDDSEIFYKIEGVAAEVWKEINSGKKLLDIKTQILCDFDVDKDILENDISTFVNDLIDKNIVK